MYRDKIRIERPNFKIEGIDYIDNNYIISDININNNFSIIEFNDIKIKSYKLFNYTKSNKFDEEYMDNINSIYNKFDDIISEYVVENLTEKFDTLVYLKNNHQTKDILHILSKYLKFDDLIDEYYCNTVNPEYVVNKHMNLDIDYNNLKYITESIYNNGFSYSSIPIEYWNYFDNNDFPHTNFKDYFNNKKVLVVFDSVFENDNYITNTLSKFLKTFKFKEVSILGFF